MAIRKSCALSLALMLAGCVSGGTGRNYYDPVKQGERASKNKSEYVEKEMANIKAAKTLTSVTLVHKGGKSETLGIAAASKKVREGDTVELGEGVYSSLSGLFAKHLRFVGMGAGRTYLNTGNKPVAVDGTDFWNMTIVETSFIARAEEGVFSIGTNYVGEISIESKSGPELAMGFGVVLGNYSTAQFKGKGPVYSVFSFHAANQADSSRSDWGFMPKDVDAFEWEWLINQGFSGLFGKKAYKGIMGNPEFYAKLDKDWEKVWARVDDPMNKFDHAEIEQYNRIAYKRLLGKLGQYMATMGYVKPEFDKARYESLMAKAKSAKGAGRELMALAIYQEANLASHFSHNDEISRLTGDAARKYREGYACGVFPKGAQGNPVGYAFTLGNALRAQFPAMQLSLGGSCKIEVEHLAQGSSTVKGASKVVGRKDVYEETAASRERSSFEELQRQAAERAADRAADRVRQARFDAAVESMQGTARKMEDGRLKTENGVTTYGSGNWAGSPDASTVGRYNTAVSDQASAQAAAAAQGSGKQYEKTGVQVSTQSSETHFSSWKSKAYVNIKGSRKTIEGPLENTSSTRTCVEEKSANGVFVLNSNCANAGGGQEKLLKEAVEKVFVPKIALMLKAQLLGGLHAPRGSDPLSQLEAAIYSKGYGVGASTADVAALSEKVLGTKRDVISLTSSALGF